MKKEFLKFKKEKTFLKKANLWTGLKKWRLEKEGEEAAACAFSWTKWNTI